jgi:Tfp pilus assembly protein PilF
VSLPPPPSPPASAAEKPHFEIQVEDGRGLLHLRPRTFYGWLRVEGLQLAIPEVHFPLDITGGMAQFQRQRCALLEATLKVERAGLTELLGRRGRLLTAAGFEEVDFSCDELGFELSARVRLREWAAELSARIIVEVEERRLRLRVVEALSFGFIRRPAPLLAHDLLCVLIGAVNGEGAATEAALARGLGVVELWPLEWFAASVLAPAGWRLPDLDGVRLSDLSLSAAGAALRWRREPGAPPRRMPHSTSAVDELAARAIDEALLRNDLAGAATACHLEMARRPERAPALTERLLGILCARDASLREAETVAREATLRWPELAAAHLALAAVATSRGRAGDAARAFGEAARLGEAAGNRTLAVRAAAAAARQVQASDPARAARLYEHILAHRPADREATEALVDLYAGAGRWAELRRLLQARLASARDTTERVEAHLRVAELSFAKLRDPAAARNDLEAAAKLAPDDRRVWSLLAQAHAQLGDVAECIAALEKLSLVLAQSGDHLAQARALLRIAGYYEDLHDDVAALRRYREALELVPDDAAALERFAAAAARYGDATDAITAYRRILERGGVRSSVRPDGRDGSGRRRRAEQQLFHLLVIIGDRDQARALLPSLMDEPSPDALSGLARLEEACDELGSAADLWARAAAQLDGQHAAAAELELARVCRAAGQPGEEQAALARAFALSPTGPEGVAAASGLIRLARAAGDVAAEAQWIDRLLACDAPSTPRHAELALRRAQLFVDAGDPAGAARVLAALAAAGHDGPAARRLAADVHGALGDARARAAALEALAGDAAGEERARLLVQAAISRCAVDEIDAAGVDVQAATALAPALLEVRVAVAEIAWRRRVWEEVTQLCGALAAELTGEARVEQLRRQAVAVDRLGRAHEAAGILTRALEGSDATGAALGRAARELGQVHERLGDAAAAVAVYKRGGGDGRVPIAGRVELFRAAAETAYRRLHDHEDAAATLQHALELDGNDLATLDALDSLQAEIGDGEGAMATLARKLSLPDAPVERRQEWLARLGELAAARGRVEAARAAFTELLALAPAHGGALRWLADDAVGRDDDADAERFDQRIVEARRDPVDERAARLRLAARARRQLRLGDAETHLWAAVELTPSAEQSPLLGQLEEVYLQAGRYADLVVILNHHAPLVGEEGARLELDLKRIGLLTRELGTPNVAVDEAQAAIARHGRAPRLVAALAAAARAAEQRPLLAETLAAQAAMTVEPRERAQLLAEAARLYQSLGEPARADALARELPVEELAPPERAALADVVSDNTLAITMLRAAAVGLEPGMAREVVLRALGQRAAGVDAAVELEALTALASDGARDVRGRLSELHEAAGQHDEAARLILELLREQLPTLRDPAPLVERLRQSARSEVGIEALSQGLTLAAAHVGRAADPNAVTIAVGWLREAAALRRARDDFAGAADALVAALVHAPENETLVAELETLLVDLGQPQRLRQILELHLATQSGEARLPTLRKLMRVVDELGDAATAGVLGAEARRLEPAAAARVNVVALARLVSPRADGQLRAGIAHVEQRLGMLSPEDVRAVRAARLELARLYRDAGRLAEAYRQLEMVLIEEPANVSARQLQIEVAEADGRWLDAAQALERLSYLLPSLDERALALHRAGELHLLRLSDKVSASDCYLKAIDIRPLYAPTLRRLVDYFWSIGDTASAAEMAATLDDEGTFAVPETPAGTRARAALALAFAGEARRAGRLATAVDDIALAALALAATELANRGGDPARVAQALRVVSGEAARVAVLRERLAQLSDPIAAALASRL